MDEPRADARGKRFCCPLPSPPPADGDLLDAGALAWMDRLGVYADRRQRDYLAAMSVGHLAARTLPDAPIAQRKVYAEFLLWIFAVDDAVFDEPLGEVPVGRPAHPPGPAAPERSAQPG
ncbi:hypothetical protein ABZ863_27135 [Saccharomonospora sp. NPDC046836]|uniref:hypothetical protein n=1 Tax=Saccharomonospora sp. NPDC046836 TaxID=3156921 RepID=UPI0033FE87A7